MEDRIGRNEEKICLEVVHGIINLAELEIAPGFSIMFQHSRPNWWWRFWHRVFFGFEWKDLAKDET